MNTETPGSGKRRKKRRRGTSVRKGTDSVNATPKRQRIHYEMPSNIKNFDLDSGDPGTRQSSLGRNSVGTDSSWSLQSDNQTLIYKTVSYILFGCMISCSTLISSQGLGVKRN